MESPRLVVEVDFVVRASAFAFLPTWSMNPLSTGHNNGHANTNDQPVLMASTVIAPCGRFGFC